MIEAWGGLGDAGAVFERPNRFGGSDAAGAESDFSFVQALN